MIDPMKARQSMMATVLGVACMLLAMCPGKVAAEHLNLTWRTTQYATISGGILTVDVPEGAANGSYGAFATLDLTPYARQEIIATVRVSGENISKPSTTWLGLKFMLHYTNPETGTEHWPDTTHTYGTFPESTYRMTDFLSAGVRSATGQLMLGLQSVSGKAVFDLSTLDIRSEPPFYPVTNESYVVSYPAHVTNGPPLRGVMLPNRAFTEDDFRTLAEWGATLGRYQMNGGPTPNSGEAPASYLVRYNAWLQGKLDHLDAVALPLAVKYGIKLVIDLHTPPGGRMADSSDMRMFEETAYKDRFISLWREIATRFRGREGVYGYDLVNEPAQKVSFPYDYWTIQSLAAEEVRRIDPSTPIIMEANDYDSPSAYGYMYPLAMDNVIYQVHMYVPGTFTHQGVNNNPMGYVYPDPDRGWDKSYLRRQFEKVRAFEARHHAKIYVGEFSAAVWAEGAGDYIRDCIEIFNEYGWDWTFHAFREWNGWSVEHVGTPPSNFQSSDDNPRKRALIEGLRAPVTPLVENDVAADSFEEFDVGTSAAQMHRGWTGNGLVVESAYDPATPPGHPMPEVTHFRAMDAREVEKDISSCTWQNRRYDMMVRVIRAAGVLEEPEDGVKFALNVDMDGRFCCWHRRMSDGRGRWTTLSDIAYENGTWVRVGVEMDRTTSADGKAFFRVALDGSLCPTPEGVRAPADHTPYGAWHWLAENALPSVMQLGDAHVDDVRITDASVPAAHTGAISTNGIGFAWFDGWGPPRRPDAAAPFIAGYTLRDVFDSGVHPYSERPLSVTGISFDAEGRVVLTFNGYKGDSPGEGYRVMRLPSSGQAGGDVSRGQGFRGDEGTWTTVWSGDVEGDSALLRVATP